MKGSGRKLGVLIMSAWLIALYTVPVAADEFSNSDTASSGGFGRVSVSSGGFSLGNGGFSRGSAFGGGFGSGTSGFGLSSSCGSGFGSGGGIGGSSSGKIIPTTTISKKSFEDSEEAQTGGDSGEGDTDIASVEKERQGLEIEGWSFPVFLGDSSLGAVTIDGVEWTVYPCNVLNPKPPRGCIGSGVDPGFGVACRQGTTCELPIIDWSEDRVMAAYVDEARTKVIINGETYTLEDEVSEQPADQNDGAVEEAQSAGEESRGDADSAGKSEVQKPADQSEDQQLADQSKEQQPADQGDDQQPADQNDADSEEPGQTGSQDSVNDGVEDSFSLGVYIKKGADKKTVVIPKTMTVNGLVADVIGIKARAFKNSRAKTLIIKTKKLTKASVKGCLKGSKVKKIKVKVGGKKANKKYKKIYKKYFKKKNCGKKVKVVC